MNLTYQLKGGFYMAKKRGNGEGSIFKRSDGRWCANVSVGTDPATGKLKRKTIYGKTRQEVVQKLTDTLNKIQTGSFIEPSKLKLKEWLAIWLYDYKKNTIRPTTFTSYEYIIRVHINPSLGHISLKDLRPEMIQKIYNDKFKNGRVDGKGGLSSRVIKYIHTILHQALEQAIKNNLILRNPTVSTTLPRKNSKKLKVLTKDEELKFLSIVKEDRLAAAFILALSSGMRLGELLALTWEAINLDSGEVKVQRALSRVRNFDDNSIGKTKLIFQEPKTKSGIRTIPIPDNVVKQLKKHKLKQKEEKLIASTLYNDSNLVFCTEIGIVLEPRNFIRRFCMLISKANLPHINFHALRHTYATRLLELNEHPKVVQELLGHSSISMTLDTYSHVLPEIKKDAANKINSLFDIESIDTIK